MGLYIDDGFETRDEMREFLFEMFVVNLWVSFDPGGLSWNILKIDNRESDKYLNCNQFLL